MEETEQRAKSKAQTLGVGSRELFRPLFTVYRLLIMNDLELTIESLAQGGAGVGRWQDRTVFVAGALPREHVRVNILEWRDTWARGVMTDLLSEPAPERITPPCPVFDRCGGCDWQYHTIASQRTAKGVILAEQLRHVGRIDAVPLQPTDGDHAWQYRQTARFHVNGRKLGFYAANSRSIVNFEQCPVVDEAINRVLPVIRELLPLHGLDDIMLRHSTTTNTVHVHLDGVGSAAWRPWAQRLIKHDGIGGVTSGTRNGWLTLAGEQYQHETIGDVRLRISPTSFFQANVERARAVHELLLDLLDLQPHTRLLDAFCGVGTFVLPLAKFVGQAHGIEEHPAAIKDAHASAKTHGISNVTFTTGKVEQILPKLDQQFDVVLLDPPRRGLERAATDAILRSQPATIAYVSCHPGTLARDVRLFHEGGYTVTYAQAHDFFPQSSHVESVVVVKKT